MKVDYKKSFFRDLKKEATPELKAEVEQVIETVKKAATMQDIPKLKKMKGYKIHYRIRVGGYRIGITIVGEVVIFWAFGPRKDFYKRFP